MKKKTGKKRVNNAKDNTVQIESIVARESDGTIQITFSIPYALISDHREKAAIKIGEGLTVPGFRKGKAPLGKLLESIPDEQLIQNTLNRILPQLLQDIVNKHKIKPAMYPKFELLNAEEGQIWQLRAFTCELPEIILGDYKNAVINEVKKDAIWTPDKASADPEDEQKTKELTTQEKEQKVIELLLKEITINIPRILVDEEVNARLSNFLERIEKLGLDLDSYLKSVGKTPQQLRSEYERQSKETIALDLILNKIAEEQGLKVTDEQLKSTIEASSDDPKVRKKLENEDQQRLIRSVLLRRLALDNLIKLLD